MHSVPLLASSPKGITRVLRTAEEPALDVPCQPPHRFCVSTAEIIREISALPPEEQLEVIAFSKALDRTRERTQEEFAALARKYQDAEDPIEVARLEEDFLEAFYGREGHA